MTKNIIIGTAGHVDHGKSTLIKALTGDETDRLAAEKERGISIEPGFSHLENDKTNSENLRLGIVDVPGHEKFVNKMLAAAGGVDLALIVIAADEGVMPQTLEHLAILDLLEVEKAIIVLTKIELVDKEWTDLIELDLKDQFKGSFAAKADIVRVDSETGKGIAALKDLIIETALKMKKRQKSEIPYYPIDRVFTLKGFGTVVTGTLFSGEIKAGEELALYPMEKTIKIRSLENHGQEVEKVEAGSRVGINIGGLEKSEIEKGNIITTPDSLLKSKFFEAELQILENLNFTIKNGDSIHFHTAALDTTGKIYLYNKKEAFPGEKVYVKLVLAEKAALFFKQKYIIRRFSPMQTIGGGEILELDPPPRRKVSEHKIMTDLDNLKKADLKEAVEIFIRKKENSAAEIKFLKKKSALKNEKLKSILDDLVKEAKIIELRTDKSYIHYQDFEKIKEDILKIINAYHKKFELRSGLKKEELRSKIDFSLNKKEMDTMLEILVKEKVLKENNNLIAEFDFKISLTKDLLAIKNKILKLYQKNLFNPPAKEEIVEQYENGASIFNYLVDNNYLVQINSELYFDQEVYSQLKIILNNYFQKNESLSLAEFRDLIGSSRRYALPLLKKLEELKLLKRKEDLRYPTNKLEKIKKSD
ncbi:MAG: selenocysteine-specific translation elongation factor [Bacillota bacterium]